MDIYVFLIAVCVVIVLLLFSRWKRNRWLIENAPIAYRVLNKTIDGKKWLGVRLSLVANIPVESEEAHTGWTKRFQQLCISADKEYLLLVVSLDAAGQTIKINQCSPLLENDANRWLAEQGIK